MYAFVILWALQRPDGRTSVGRSECIVAPMQRPRSRIIAAVIVAAVLAGGLTFDATGGRPAAAAADDCGLAGAVNSFDAGGADEGAFNDPNMWDAGVVPTSGQACILADKTAQVPNGVTAFPDLLGIEGTLE